MSKRRAPADRHSLSMFPEDDGADVDDTAEPPEPKYVQDSDGLWMEVLKPHSLQKHELIRKYIEICRSVRKKWRDLQCRNTYIDLFAGPGRSCDATRRNQWSSGAVMAYEASAAVDHAVPFDLLFIADLEERMVDSTCARLARLNAPFKPHVGDANSTADRIIPALGDGFHFAVLDPWGLKALPFTLVEKFLPVNHLDLVIHISRQGLVRNLGHNLRGTHRTFDAFLPQWRSVYDKTKTDAENIERILNCYRETIANRGPKLVRRVRRIGSGNRTLYWLFLVSGHPLAEDFWGKIDPQERDSLRLD